MTSPSSQRWRERRSKWRSDVERIDPSLYRVDGIGRTAAAAFVREHHYSGSHVASRLDVGLYRGVELVGVCAFSVGVQPEASRRWCGVAPAEGIELGRLVLLDREPCNAESWFVAQAFRLLRAELPEVRAVLSYSDPVPRQGLAGEVVMPGHVGVVYQALNARYVGRSAPRSLLVAPDGSRISQRTLDKIRDGHRGHAAAVDMLVRLGARRPRLGEDLAAWLCEVRAEPPFRRTRHPGCHAYVWAVDGAPETWAGLAPSAGPYPKRDRAAQPELWGTL